MNTEDNPQYNEREAEKKEQSAYNINNQKKKHLRFIIRILIFIVILAFISFCVAVWNRMNALYQENLEFAQQEKAQEATETSNFDNFNLYSTATDAKIDKLETKQEELSKLIKDSTNDIKNNFKKLEDNVTKNIEDIKNKTEKRLDRQEKNINDFIQDQEKKNQDHNKDMNKIEEIEKKIVQMFNDLALKKSDKKTNDNKQGGKPSSGDFTDTDQNDENERTASFRIPIEVEDIPLDQNSIEEIKQKTTHSINIFASTAQGITITGGSATVIGMGRQQDLPIQIKLTQDMIAANDNTKKSKGCYVYASGVGNMTDNTVNIRLTKISCIFEDKSGQQYIAEGPIKGWVTDENGNNGIGGILVTKEQKIFQAALPLALYQSGLDALSKLGSTTLLSGYSTTSSNLLSSVNTGLTSSGNTTINRLTTIYEKYLQAMNPVVNIKAGRVISIHFVGGEILQLVPFKAQEEESNGVNIDKKEYSTMGDKYNYDDYDYIFNKNSKRIDKEASQEYYYDDEEE
ncbi:hypothetical protein CQA57_05705 [Helicobacter anseris]|uniref:Conjugal transfer protein TraB n=1 Tax=Helicobacter anseris TaxID=375926 RepID=A0A3D8J6W2_9HELI|nr:TrbI/VirB10 family protein [Helicobacter anseris]RDU73020.1 hypothetical protein CQA57_05705 [Helicobacter anseris]